jgi:hypothetical protein
MRPTVQFETEKVGATRIMVPVKQSVPVPIGSLGVRDARVRKASESMTQAEIAGHFGISQQQVSRILRGSRTYEITKGRTGKRRV